MGSVSHITYIPHFLKLGQHTLCVKREGEVSPPFCQGPQHRFTPNTGATSSLCFLDSSSDTVDSNVWCNQAPGQPCLRTLAISLLGPPAMMNTRPQGSQQLGNLTPPQEQNKVPKKWRSMDCFTNKTHTNFKGVQWPHTKITVKTTEWYQGSNVLKTKREDQQIERTKITKQKFQSWRT